jgi:hypothetical protein
VTGTTGVERSARAARHHLPKTAGTLSLVVLLGLGSIGAALGLTVFRKFATASAV